MQRAASRPFGRLVPQSRSLVSSIFQAAGWSHAASSTPPDTTTAFDESLLASLVCPLAKTPLRYDRQQQLLVNDEVGIEYPIVNGVPYLTPTKARLLNTEPAAATTSQSDK